MNNENAIGNDSRDEDRDTANEIFLEVDFDQRCKDGQYICGDTFLSRKSPSGKRVISVLSDGLGSGVKANILSSMTATMASRFAESNMEFLHSAEIMMDALPVCRIRQISYATFTIVDSALHGWTRIIEMDNPECFLIRNGDIVPQIRREISSERWKDRKIRMGEVYTIPEDRLILLSDGVTQAGMGSRPHPLGWRDSGVREFVLRTVRSSPDISARQLSHRVIEETLLHEPHGLPGDDMTCAVMFFRRPRRLLLLSGPPYDKGKDAEYAMILGGFKGKKVICGGTTADIVARELKRTIRMDLRSARRGYPPESSMDGVDLVTEGILTLTRACKIIERLEDGVPVDPASRLVELFMESDRITFVVGTRINEAHQDPSLPVELEIRRNIVRNLAHLLETRHLKETEIRYI